MGELEFYSKAKNWDFSMINYTSETASTWDMYDILKKSSNPESVILDLGTAAGEKVLKYFPECKRIVGTDYSYDMIENAKKNLAESGKKNIEFMVMDNLRLEFNENTFDIVTARHTVIDPKGIYKVLKPGGLLIVRGVDKYDCWDLKEMFGRGQAFFDKKPISEIDFEAIKRVGFQNVIKKEIKVNEYYKTKEDLMMLLCKTPILTDFSEIGETEFKEYMIDEEIIDRYIGEHTTEKGILLSRVYYGITGRKKKEVQL